MALEKSEQELVDAVTVALIGFQPGARVRMETPTSPTWNGRAGTVTRVGAYFAGQEVVYVRVDEAFEVPFLPTQVKLL